MATGQGQEAEVRGGMSWGPIPATHLLIALKVWSQKRLTGRPNPAFLPLHLLTGGQGFHLPHFNPEPGCPRGCLTGYSTSGPGDLTPGHKLPGCPPLPRSRPLGDETSYCSPAVPQMTRSFPTEGQQEACPDGWPAEPRKAASVPPLQSSPGQEAQPPREKLKIV